MPNPSPSTSINPSPITVFATALFTLFTPLASPFSHAQTPSPITLREKNDLEFSKKILSDHYIEPTNIHAAITSLRMNNFLRSLRGGAFTRGFATRPASLAPILAMLPKEIAYFRPRAFDSAFPQSAITRLQIWCSGKIAGLIIDLRGLQGGSPTETYAKILAILDGKGDAILQWDKNKIYVHLAPTSTTIPMRILISEHTSGLYEAFLHALKSPHTQIIGQPTPGRAAAFREFAMPSGDFLAIAHRRLYWRNQPIPFGNPVIPDHQIHTPFQQIAHSLYLIETGQVRRLFLYSTKESLKDESTSSKTKPSPPPIQDQALLQAWDSLHALSLIKQQIRATSTIESTATNAQLPTSSQSP